jgi:hypothetical protein
MKDTDRQKLTPEFEFALSDLLTAVTNIDANLRIEIIKRDREIEILCEEYRSVVEKLESQIKALQHQLLEK